MIGDKLRHDWSTLHSLQAFGLATLDPHRKPKSIGSIHEACNFDHFNGRVFIKIGPHWRSRPFCGVPAHGSPSRPLQFD